MADNSSQAAARTRRGFLGAFIASIASGLVIVLLWLVSRNAPSAGRDPHLTPFVVVPTRPPVTPSPALSTVTPTVTRSMTATPVRTGPTVTPTIPGIM